MPPVLPVPPGFPRISGGLSPPHPPPAVRRVLKRWPSTSRTSGIILVPPAFGSTTTITRPRIFLLFPSRRIECPDDGPGQHLKDLKRTCKRIEPVPRLSQDAERILKLLADSPSSRPATVKTLRSWIDNKFNNRKNPPIEEMEFGLRFRPVARTICGGIFLMVQTVPLSGKPGGGIPPARTKRKT